MSANDHQFTRMIDKSFTLDFDTLLANLLYLAVSFSQPAAFSVNCFKAVCRPSAIPSAKRPWRNSSEFSGGRIRKEPCWRFGDSAAPHLVAVQSVGAYALRHQSCADSFELTSSD